LEEKIRKPTNAKTLMQVHKWMKEQFPYLPDGTEVRKFDLSFKIELEHVIGWIASYVINNPTTVNQVEIQNKDIGTKILDSTNKRKFKKGKEK
jgi:hypothetical protein